MGGRDSASFPKKAGQLGPQDGGLVHIHLMPRAGDDCQPGIWNLLTQLPGGGPKLAGQPAGLVHAPRPHLLGHGGAGHPLADAQRGDHQDLASIQGDAREEPLQPLSGLLRTSTLEQIVGS